MVKSLLLGAALLSTAAFGQTTLFSDNFNTAASWTLNLGSGGNQWIIDNTYASGFEPFIAPTPAQPAAIPDGPASNYMHIYNSAYCELADFGCNAVFDAETATQQVAQMTNPVATTGYTDVNISFYYLCAGAANIAYGQLEYSTDNTNWQVAGSNYSGVSTWTLSTVTLPAFNNQATLKFRFRWVNDDSGTGADPAFSVDEMKITGISGMVPPTIATGTVSDASWCFQSQASVTIPFTVTGTVNAGNIYTAQLSDAAGSFAAPVSIGTLASSANGSLSISGNIPGGTAVGSGYRIRVVASDPATTGTDNGTDLSVDPLPPVTVNSVTICTGMMATLTANGAVTYTWTPPTGLSATTGATVTADPAATTTYTVTGTSQLGCSSTATSVVTVQSCAGIEENTANAIILYPNPASDLVTLSNSNATEVTVYSVNGQKLQTIKVENGIFSLGGLAGGTYFIGTEDSKELLRLTKL